jgi:hypothetical protein
MREVKRLFDPDGRMNPGNIVDAPPMTDDLRDAALTPPCRSARGSTSPSSAGCARPPTAA